jgi:hypothetical protein
VGVLHLTAAWGVRRAQTRYNKWYEYSTGSGVPSMRGDGRVLRRERRRERRHAEELAEAIEAVTNTQVPPLTRCAPRAAASTTLPLPLPAAALTVPESWAVAYSDDKVANRDTKIWHLVIENGY